jgi:hypothetical protein
MEMKKGEKMICALLFGEARTEEKAKQIAQSYRNCPYIDLMATRENQLFATFFLPEKQKWWIEHVAEKPKETFGLENVTVKLIEEVQYPTHLSMHLPEEQQRISPCGSDCCTCPAYEKCLGCPATIFYKNV